MRRSWPLFWNRTGMDVDSTVIPLFISRQEQSICDCCARHCNITYSCVCVANVELFHHLWKWRLSLHAMFGNEPGGTRSCETFWVIAYDGRSLNVHSNSVVSLEGGVWYRGRPVEIISRFHFATAQPLTENHCRRNVWNEPPDITIYVFIHNGIGGTCHRFENEGWAQSDRQGRYFIVWSYLKH